MFLNARIIFLVPLRCNSKHLNFVAPATEMQCAAVFSDNQHECKEVIITVCQTSGFSTQLLSKVMYSKYYKKSDESCIFLFWGGLGGQGSKEHYGNFATFEDVFTGFFLIFIDKTYFMYIAL